MSTWEPTEQWLDERFRRYVQPRLDRGAHRDGRPVLVLLGGQPGAGKSRAAQFAQELHAGRLVEVTGDDFRRLHPEHKRLQQQEPQRMPNVTSAVSGPLVARSIEYARANRCSILLEGVFRDPDVVTRTAIEFHDAGFHVHAIALAVPPEVSRASALGRYLQTLDTAQSRWTPPTAHDSAVAGIPATVESLGGSL